MSEVRTYYIKAFATRYTGDDLASHLENGPLDSDEAGLAVDVTYEIDALRAALAEAQRELAAYQAEHEGCIDIWRRECATVHAERNVALARAESAERERDEARWNPLEDYHKQHVPACRKFMYDPKSSPCTCRLEWSRLVFACDAATKRADSAERELAEAREALRGIESGQHSEGARSIARAFLAREAKPEGEKS